MALVKRSVLKISPTSVAFFPKVKRNCQELLKPKTKMDKKERAQRFGDIATDMSFARARWEEVHGQGQLVDQLKNWAFAMTEYRLYQDYGD